jgi:hypothetical protein
MPGSPTNTSARPACLLVFFVYRAQAEVMNAGAIRISDFGLDSSFGFRHSSFKLQVSSFRLPIFNRRYTPIDADKHHLWSELGIGVHRRSSAASLPET